jgi:benzoate-CoA ligase
LPARLYQEWRERFGCEILDGLGSSELSTIPISNLPGEVRPGSSGRLVPGHDARIVDEHGDEVGDGEVGTLTIRAPSMFTHYWHDIEGTRQKIRGEWYWTGDQFSRDADGYFWHAGRSDDMLRVGGLWISPEEIEDQIAAHGQVLECAVVPWRGADGLCRPKAFIVPRESAQSREQLVADLRDFFLWHLQPPYRPHAIQFIEAVPRTATGKAQRFLLRDGTVEGVEVRLAAAVE